MSLPVLEEPVRFHLSLNVPDLNRAVEFYSTLFAMPPTKRHDNYAKFDLEDPPVVFSLVPHPPGPGCSLSHLGLKVDSDDRILQFRERLESAGISSECQDDTTCGYAKQNKLWIKDPFGNFWEIHRVMEDVRPEQVRLTIDGKAARVDVPECGTKATSQLVWEHFITNPLPERIPHDDATVDEVRLVGTFNANLSEDQRVAFLADVFRILKPAGKVLTHGLMADRLFPGNQPTLPGLAALVSRVPVQTEPGEALGDAGFVGMQIVKYPDKAWFTHQGVGLREVKILAWKPASVPNDEIRQVLYKGPFARASIDGGQIFERGKRTPVTQAVWEQLRLGSGAEQFLFFEAGNQTSCSMS